MPLMNSLMIGFMILFMAGFMILLMVVAHSIKSEDAGRHDMLQHMFPAINWTVKVLLRLGIPMTLLGPIKLLTIRGRKSGTPRTLPIDLYEHAGQHFLIATHGEGNWVYNLRATGKGSLSLGRKHQAFTALELPAEDAGSVIKEVLGPLLTSQGVSGSVLRQHLDVTADSSQDDFTRAAQSHPVFQLSFPETLSSQR